MRKVLLVFGTRPEAIKMAPVVRALVSNSEIHVEVCITGQHKELLNQVMEVFDLKALYNLEIMKSNQSLNNLSAQILINIEAVYDDFGPDIVLVHGDTATAFCASLAAYYAKIPVGHVEAGLRTDNLFSPWPEEGNRKLIAGLATLHFAPTPHARENLIKENVDKNNISVTGNTIIDALDIITEKINTDQNLSEMLYQKYDSLINKKHTILVTCHRRENFGNNFVQICDAIWSISTKFQNYDIIFPVHPNPNISSVAKAKLASRANINLIEPLDYISFVYIMMKCTLILSDSGGIQEEAATLRKPVMLLRDTTERPEAINAGNVQLVGTSTQKIVDEVSRILTNQKEYKKMCDVKNPFGDGNASQKIEQLIVKYLK